MASFIKDRWISEATGEIPRAECRSCEYKAYLPDPLVEQAFEASEVIDAFTDLERQLASPEANTSGRSHSTC